MSLTIASNVGLPKQESIMKIFIKYNSEGEIISVAKVSELPIGLDQPYGMLEEHEFVLDVSGKKGLGKLNALQIHEGYHVDVKKAKLVKSQ